MVSVLKENLEIRSLTEREFKTLIEEADTNETWGLKRLESPYEYLSKNSVESSGMIGDGRPLYFACLIKENDKYTLWTVVNKNVKSQFSMYKFSKRIVSEWAKKYKEIYATMRTVNQNNIEWTKRIGFKVISQYDDIIKFKLVEES